MSLLAVVLSVSVAPAAFAAASILFPTPLHLTRELTNPVSGTKSVVDEYCHGNRVVSVSGSRTAIADYDKGEITAIDFAAGTYSVTKFADVAAAQGLGRANGGVRAESKAAEAWNVSERGGRVVGSRPGVAFEAEQKSATVRQVLHVTADSQLTLSRAALEALIGYAYPNAPDASADAVMNMLREHGGHTAGALGKSDAHYRLPLEHNIRVEAGNDSFEARNIVMRVGNELPPAGVLAIPPGAKRVESPIVAARRELEALDHPAATPHH
ncbi:MAG TPA: hypothetical protein VF824_13240 [Thermoanaerobaculia bacterium]|jgi:hypothetical protein